MTTKEELAIWNKATNLYKKDNADRLYNNGHEHGGNKDSNYKEAIKLFSSIDKYSKVLFNIGMIYLSLRDCENADILFGKALLADQYFAAAYYQKGQALFLLYEYELALRCYEFCLDLLLNNDFIDYTTLGLSFKMYRCEVLYNLAVCNLELGNGRKADSLLREAHTCRRTYEHKSIISNMVPGNAVLFAIPSHLLFRVPEEKLKNLKKKDFLKEAKLVVDTKPKTIDSGGVEKVAGGSSTGDDGFIGFTGAAIINPGETTPGSTLVRRKTEADHSAAAKEPAMRSATLPRFRPNDSFRPTHKRNASEPSISLPRYPNSPRRTVAPQSPSSSLSSGGSRRLPDSHQQQRQALDKDKQFAKKSQMRSRKSSLPTSRFPLTGRAPSVPIQTPSPALSDQSFDSGFEDVSAAGLRNMTLADDIYEASETLTRSTTSSRRSDIKIIIHNKKANTSFRTKRGIHIDDFFKDVMDALNLADVPQNLCFVDDDETMIDLLDQEDLDIALSFHKTVHIYSKAQFQSPDALIDLYDD